MDITNKEDVIKGTELIIKYIIIFDVIFLLVGMFMDFGKYFGIMISAFNILGLLVYKGIKGDVDRIVNRGSTYGKKSR